jgi:NUMOD4 motif-containing protein
MARERWRNVPGWPPYRVSSNGRVRGHRGLMKPVPDRDGYLYVRLQSGGRQRRAGVAVLVLEAFAPPRLPGMEACHGPQARGRDDCRLEVLRWDDRLGNERDKLSGWSETAGAVSRPDLTVFPVTAGQA